MVVRSVDHAKKIFARWVGKGIKWVAKDTETQPKPAFPDPKSTLIRGRMDIIIFSMCHRGEKYCFPTSRISNNYPTLTEWMQVCNTHLYEKLPKLCVVYQNANYDIEPLREGGMCVTKFWDTLISGWISNQNEDKSLKVRAPYYGRYLRDTRSVDFSNLSQLAEYAEDDVLVTDEIYQQHRYGYVMRDTHVTYVLPSGKLMKSPVIDVPTGKIVVEEEILTPFHRLFLECQEFPVLRATMRAEKLGMLVDKQRLAIVAKKCEEDIERHKKEVYRLAGRKFELGSLKQKLAVLQEAGVPLTRTTKGGAISTKADFLIPFINYPIVNAMLEHSKVVKLYSNYLGPKGFKYFIRPSTQSIHPTLNTVGAVTGRFSSSSPNLQTVPARKDRYKIKSVFTAPKGESIICLDFSQIELRVMALMSQDPVMVKELNDPKGDIHSATARNLDVPRDPVAKQCNFLLIFGGGGYALRERLLVEGHYMEIEEADQIVTNFDNTYRRVSAFREEMFAYHRQMGYIPLLTGRRRIIENIGSNNRYERHKAETQLANNVVQGSAQDLLKCSIVRCDHRLLNYDRILPKRLEMGSEHRHFLDIYAKEIEDHRKFFKDPACKLTWRLQVHDEVLYRAKEKRAIEAAQRIAKVMSWRPYWQPLYEFNVAIRADGGVGPDWLAAKKPSDSRLKIESPLVIWN